jgi:CO/xanthine dehydrogenase FAD-binding subunit
MDLNSIGAVAVPRSREALADWREGDAWLAGGTWLFSEPQPTLRRLVDLAGLGWLPYEVEESGLTLAATCTIAQLDRLEPPASWIAAPLIGQCCRALLGSFKIWNMATVGGNICLALPAGPMIALCIALEGTGVVWTHRGDERRSPVRDLVLGPQRNALAPGEVLRAIEIPHAALRRRTAFRRAALSPAGRSGALVIGTHDPSGAFALTVTAATRRPVRLAFEAPPAAVELIGAIEEAIPDEAYYDDVHGTPEWRRHMTHVLAEEIRRELGGKAP